MIKALKPVSIRETFEFLQYGLLGNGLWHSQEYNPAFVNGGISASIRMLTAPKDE
jgi:hypothetical protein